MQLFYSRNEIAHIVEENFWKKTAENTGTQLPYHLLHKLGQKMQIQVIEIELDLELVTIAASTFDPNLPSSANRRVERKMRIDRPLNWFFLYVYCGLV